MKQEKRYDETILKQPPQHNDDYERGIIKSCLSASFHESETRDYAIKRLKYDYFYNTTYKDCFHAICDMINGTYGQRVPYPDEMTFSQYTYTNAERYDTFRKLKERDDVTGLQTFQLFAFDIMESEFLDVNGKVAVLEIIEMYKRRRRYSLAVELESMTGEWFDEPEKRQTIYDQLAELETIGNEVYDEYFTPDTLTATSSALQHQGGGLKTGYMLHKDQHGQHITQEFTIPPKQITVVAAATGHGKSTFCYNLAKRLIDNNTRPSDGTKPAEPVKVVYLSYEESVHNIAPKIINVLAGVNLDENNRVAIADDLAKGGTGKFLEKIPDKTLRDTLRKEYTRAVKEYYDMAATGTLTVKYCDLDAADLCGLIREFRRRDMADVVIIDYVQLQEKETSKSHGRNRPDELKEICADLRRVANDEKFGLPIIVASQFNREVQRGNDPRKMDKTNLGESANIEHVANVILGLWNCQETNTEQYMNKDENGNPTNEPNDDGKRLLAYQNTKHIDDPFIYARLLKSRDGVNGLNMTLNYYGNCGRIDNTTDESPNKRATGVRDESTEPHNTYNPEFRNDPKPAPAADTSTSGTDTAINNAEDLPF